jgi:hypothetical protein
LAALSLAVLIAGCISSEPEAVAPAPRAATTVKLDFLHKPLPEIPLPNDIATVYDASSATSRRVNASMVAPTGFERRTRERLDQLDGWGVFQAITVPFTGPLDVGSILAGHRDVDYDTRNDVVYLINIDRGSPEFGKVHPLDVGNGNYPVTLKDRNRFWDNDTRAGLVSMLFDEVDEDTNGNGVLDPGEDTDGDGVLDKPNYLPGSHPSADDPAARTDALMSFYESETNTLIVRPMEPLRERTVYAVVVTRRIHDANGQPVGSPYPGINHTAQTEALKPLREVLPPGLALSDVAFAFTFTTQSIDAPWRAVRDGLYERGVQAHLGRLFPPEVTELFPMRDAPGFPNMTQPQIVYGENWLRALQILGPALLGVNINSAEYKQLSEGIKYVDYFVIGSYESPQLFPRTDANGNPLSLNEQTWPPDLDRVPAPTRPETIYFTLAVPRKEVSARGHGQPAPVALLGHGYTGQRFAVMQFAGYFARHGLATIGIDGPSHGIGLAADQEELARFLLSGINLGGLVDATFKDRAFDQNGDGVKDSGADFWTSYLFHTRDIVRQFMLDYSQLVRIIKTFDGRHTWKFDLGADGQADLAGDFDGDGELDIGGDAPITMTGGSLGGIMSMLMGSTEPGITAIAPIAGGGGYSDMGIRSVQGGVVEAFMLRVMGPLYTATLNHDTGKIAVQAIVPQLNDLQRYPLGEVAGVQPGDTMVAENLINGVRACGPVDASGHARVSLESDRGDRIRIVFYQGAQQLPGVDCQLRAEAIVRGKLETFGQDVTHQAHTFQAGSPLVAVEDGLGLPRSTPDLRRMNGIAQAIMDPGDPAAYARHLLTEPLDFGTGERTGAHAVTITSQGDMNVPASSGVSFGRAAGLIDYRNSDSRYGKPDNQVLIDTYTAEAVDNLKRHVDSTGKGVHLDVENFSQSDDIWGPSYPRLDPPLRIGVDRTDRLGGVSASLFPLTQDTGRHGFGAPGEMLDRFRQQCRDRCTMTGGSDPCSCNQAMSYDVGTFLISVLSDYLASNGTVLDLDRCHSLGNCPQHPPTPAQRNTTMLP